MAQLVERDLAKVEAAGSSPVSRSLMKAQKYREIGTPEFFILSIIAYNMRPSPLGAYSRLDHPNQDLSQEAVTVVPRIRLYL